MSKRQTFEASEQITVNEDGSVVRLRYPIAEGSTSIETLTVKRPKARHLKTMDEAKGEIGKELRLMEELTGQTTRALGELEAEDFATIDEVIKGYMGKSRSTGGTS